jgi:hypothetical protein
LRVAGHHREQLRGGYVDRSLKIAVDDHHREGGEHCRTEDHQPTASEDAPIVPPARNADRRSHG